MSAATCRWGCLLLGVLWGSLAAADDPPRAVASEDVAPVAAPKVAPADSAARIGLIDMAYVFNNMRQFNARRNEIEAEIKRIDRKGRQMSTELQQLQADLKGYIEGSEAYLNVERQIIRKKADLEEFTKTTQREILQKEAAAYLTTYKEVTSEVARYAKEHGYALVLRFTRDSLDGVQEPKKILERMNHRQVIFHQPEDDMTDAIVDRLNRRFTTEIQ